MKQLIGLLCAGLMWTALGQNISAARAAYQQQQAVQEVQRLAQQFDQLVNNQEAIVGRLSRLESGSSRNDDIKAEMASLRAQIEQLRRDQENMRREIVADLAKRIAALPRAAPAPAPAPAANSSSRARRNAARPAPAPVPTSEYTGAYYEHEVKAGQTLSIIAKGFDVPLAKILQANPGIKGKPLRIGQKIRVPADKQ